MAKMKVVQVPKAGADFELRRKSLRLGLVRIGGLAQGICNLFG
jgi:hypothetical protein